MPRANFTAFAMADSFQNGSADGAEVHSLGAAALGVKGAGQTVLRAGQQILSSIGRGGDHAAEILLSLRGELLIEVQITEFGEHVAHNLRNTHAVGHGQALL